MISFDCINKKFVQFSVGIYGLNCIIQVKTSVDRGRVVPTRRLVDLGPTRRS